MQTPRVVDADTGRPLTPLDLCVRFHALTEDDHALTDWMSWEKDPAYGPEWGRGFIRRYGPEGNWAAVAGQDGAFAVFRRGCSAPSITGEVPGGDVDTRLALGRWACDVVLQLDGIGTTRPMSLRAEDRGRVPPHSTRIAELVRTLGPTILETARRSGVWEPDLLDAFADEMSFYITAPF